MRFRMASIALLLFCVVGCKTAPIGPPLRVPVPPELSRSDAEIAIVTMLTAPPERRSQAETQTLVIANPLGAMLWDQYRDAQVRSKHWFVESWTDGEIMAGYQQRLYYLRVRIEVSDSAVTLEIDDSRHLKQSNTRIHKNAKVWVEMLETDIRDSLGRALVIRRQLGFNRNSALLRPAA